MNEHSELCLARPCQSRSAHTSYAWNERSWTATHGSQPRQKTSSALPHLRSLMRQYLPMLSITGENVLWLRQLLWSRVCGRGRLVQPTRCRLFRPSSLDKWCRADSTYAVYLSALLVFCEHATAKPYRASRAAEIKTWHVG